MQPFMWPSMFDVRKCEDKNFPLGNSIFMRCSLCSLRKCTMQAKRSSPELHIM